VIEGKKRVWGCNIIYVFQNLKKDDEKFPLDHLRILKDELFEK